MTSLSVACVIQFNFTPSASFTAAEATSWLTVDVLPVWFSFHLTCRPTRHQKFSRLSSVNWVKLDTFHLNPFHVSLDFMRLAGVDGKRGERKNIVDRSIKKFLLQLDEVWLMFKAFLHRFFSERRQRPELCAKILESNYESICVIKWTDSHLIMFRRFIISSWAIIWRNSRPLSLLISHDETCRGIFFAFPTRRHLSNFLELIRTAVRAWSGKKMWEMFSHAPWMGNFSARK